MSPSMNQLWCIYYTCFCITHRGITVANTYWFLIPTGTHQLNLGLLIGVYMSFCVVTIPIPFDTLTHKHTHTHTHTHTRTHSSHKKFHVHLNTQFYKYMIKLDQHALEHAEWTCILRPQEDNGASQTQWHRSKTEFCELVPSWSAWWRNRPHNYCFMLENSWNSVTLGITGFPY